MLDTDIFSSAYPESTSWSIWEMYNRYCDSETQYIMKMTKQHIIIAYTPGRLFEHTKVCIIPIVIGLFLVDCYVNVSFVEI